MTTFFFLFGCRCVVSYRLLWKFVRDLCSHHQLDKRPTTHAYSTNDHLNVCTRYIRSCFLKVTISYTKHLLSMRPSRVPYHYLSRLTADITSPGSPGLLTCVKCRVMKCANALEIRKEYVWMQVQQQGRSKQEGALRSRTFMRRETPTILLLRFERELSFFISPTFRSTS